MGILLARMCTAYLEFSEAGRWCQIPGNWNDWGLWDSTSALGIEPQSSTNSASAPNLWAISSATRSRLLLTTAGPLLFPTSWRKYFNSSQLEIMGKGAGEMVQQLRALVAFLEDLGLTSSTHITDSSQLSATLVPGGYLFSSDLWGHIQAKHPNREGRNK